MTDTAQLRAMLAGMRALSAMALPWKQDPRSPHYIVDAHGFIVVRCDVPETLAGIVALVNAAEPMLDELERLRSDVARLSDEVAHLRGPLITYRKGFGPGDGDSAVVGDPA